MSIPNAAVKLTRVYTHIVLEHVCKAATLPQRIKLAQTCYRNVHAILRRKHPRPILPSVRRTDPEVCASANLGFLQVLSDPRLPIGVQNKLYQEFCEEKNFIATASSKLGSLAIHVGCRSALFPLQC